MSKIDERSGSLLIHYGNIVYQQCDDSALSWPDYDREMLVRMFKKRFDRRHATYPVYIYTRCYPWPKGENTWAILARSLPFDCNAPCARVRFDEVYPEAL